MHNGINSVTHNIQSCQNIISQPCWQHSASSRSWRTGELGKGVVSPWPLRLAGWMHDSSYLLSVMLAVPQQEFFEYMAPLLGLFDYGLPISSLSDYELKLLWPSRSVYKSALQMDSLSSRIWTISSGTKV